MTKGAELLLRIGFQSNSRGVIFRPLSITHEDAVILSIDDQRFAERHARGCLNDDCNVCDPLQRHDPPLSFFRSRKPFGGLIVVAQHGGSEVLPSKERYMTNFLHRDGHVSATAR